MPEPVPADIEGLVAEATTAIEDATSTDEIRGLGVSLIGKQSPLVRIRAGLGALDPN
jgi:hypothetical protein